MRVTTKEYMDSLLNLVPFPQVRLNTVYTLYEKAMGEYYKYDNLIVSTINFDSISIVEASSKEEFTEKYRDEWNKYGKTWFLV